MENPVKVIEKIKNNMSEIIIENNLNYLDINIDDLLILYSADLCSILLDYFPGATIMMTKNFKCCAIMIQGVIYNSKGIVDSKNYFIAGPEEINFIQKSFNQLSDSVMMLLKEKNKNSCGNSYILRKNKDNLV